LGLARLRASIYKDGIFFKKEEKIFEIKEKKRKKVHCRNQYFHTTTKEKCYNTSIRTSNYLGFSFFPG
jgi:glucan biosynthesis protein